MNFKVLEAAAVLGVIAILVTGFAPTWTQTSAPTNQNWLEIASSADGKIACAINSASPALISTNGGNTWPTNGNLTAYAAIAMSADGQRLIMSAFTNSGIYILVSTNIGNIWNQTILPSGDWKAVSSSADGTKLVAADNGGFIYASTNSGATWNTNTTLTGFWTSLASSADGSRVVVAATGHSIYISTNSGWDWLPTTSPVGTRGAICSSSTGGTFAETDMSATFISTNYGVTWITTNITGQTIACSADGTKLVVAGGQIWTSDDSGMTWTTNNTPLSCRAVVSSADGCKLAATGFNGQGIWVGQAAVSPQLKLQPAGSGLAFSWLVPSTNFVLQQSADLSPASWTTLTNLPVLNPTNLQEQIILSSSNAVGFFRLLAQ